MQNIKTFIFSITFSFLTVSNTFGAEINVAEIGSRTIISQHCSYYCDSTNRLSISDVLVNSYHFVSQENIGKPDTLHVYWSKAELSNSGKTKQYILFLRHIWEYINAYKIENIIKVSSHTQSKLVFLFSETIQFILFSLAIGHKFITIKKTTEALKQEGFGVLTEIDIHEKLKEKIGVDFRKYKILGACNPPLAYKALQKEDKIGTMLPCNVIVQQLEDNKVEIAAVDPMAAMQAVENKELIEVAKAVKEKLEKAISILT